MTDYRNMHRHPEMPLDELLTGADMLKHALGETSRDRAIVDAMARRLRKLKKRHHPDVTNCTVPVYPGGDSYVPCKCGRLLCPDAEILEGRDE